jgi:hypothetical protein
VNTADDIKRLAGLIPRARGDRSYEGTIARLHTAIDALAGERDALLEALRDMLDRYVGLVVSGDAGNWDAEQEPEVIASRAAIKKCEEPK